MGYIDYCSLCIYAYTKDCKHGSKECNQEKARIIKRIFEVSNKIKQKERANDEPTERRSKILG